MWAVTVLAAVAGQTASHPVVGIDRTVEIVSAMAREAANRAGRPCRSMAEGRS